MADQSITARKIKGINKIGLYTLVRKEVVRFLKVYMQTLVAPAVTTLLFYTVFALAFGGIDRDIGGNVPFLTFLAPGLIMMSMVQNAFANTSSSLIISKVQGNIVDILMPPLSSGEILTGFLSGAVLRGLAVGTITLCFLSVFAPITIHSVPTIIMFAILGTYMLGALGVIAGIWCERFDHMAAFTNFIVTPMTFLSGTFYRINMLPEIWQNIAHLNPFFYMIDGFRYGFIGQSDGNITIGIIMLVVMNALLTVLCYKLLKSGYKIKS